MGIIFLFKKVRGLGFSRPILPIFANLTGAFANNREGAKK